MLIYEKSRPGRQARAQTPGKQDDKLLLAGLKDHLRREDVGLPEVSELDVVRHYTNLSAKNFAIDKQFYPLGSCTMKYNPEARIGQPAFPVFWLVILLRQNRLARDIWLAFTNCNKSWPK